MNYFDLLETIDEVGQHVDPNKKHFNVNRKTGYKELLNIQLWCGDFNFFETDSRKLEKTKNYLHNELAWYLSGDRNIDRIGQIAKQWLNISNRGNVNSNYGHLLFYSVNQDGYTQFEWAKKCLLEDKHSRQAVCFYNQPKYQYEENKDFVCTLNQSFFIRNNFLHSFVNIRSSDAIYGLTYDIPWYSIYQQNMLLHLKSKYKDLKLGVLEINIFSSHFYMNHEPLVKSLIKDKKKYFFIKLKKKIELNKDYDFYLKNISKMIQIKEVEL